MGKLLEHVTAACLNEESERNAFNSIPWEVIDKEMARIGISAHIRRLMASYLTDRYLTLGDGSSRVLTCGVPQGSVLGPALWQMSVRRNVHLVAYAGDLVIISTARKETELQGNMNHALRLVKREITEKGLKIAIDNTETIFLSGRKNSVPFASLDKCREEDTEEADTE